MNILNRCICIGAAFVMPACGSDDSPPVGWVPPPQPPTVTTRPGGIWFGSLQYGDLTTSEDAAALVTEEGYFHILSIDSDVSVIGDFLLSGTPFQGAGQFYPAATGDPADPGDRYWVDFFGDITAQSSMSISWSSASEPSGELTFFYDASLYERDSHLDQLTGSWTGSEDDGNPWMEITVDAYGSFTGQDTGGCSSSGRFWLIDSRFNLYDVRNLTFDCDPAGDLYFGLAHLSDVNDEANTALFMSVSNGSQALRLNVSRN